MLPASDTLILASVHGKGVGQLATNLATLQPRRNYPNRLVSDGGMLHLTV